MAIAVVFFDLGETLVHRKGATSEWTKGAVQCLEDLAGSGLRLGVISNTANLSRPELLARLPPDFSFDRFEAALVLLSGEVGVEKPDPRIFRKAVQRAGVAPEACAFVGEDLEETWSAQGQGMRALRVAAFPADLEAVARFLG